MHLGMHTVCVNAHACFAVRLWVNVWHTVHVHMCICVSFIWALALSGVTSAPYAAPGLTQYAHTDEDQLEMQMSYTRQTHTHTTHTFICITSSFLFYPLSFVFTISVVFPAVCVSRVGSSALLVCVCWSGWASRLHWPPSPCVASSIFDSSKGCVGHIIIGMLSDFLFVMITQNNKSEITFFVQWKEEARRGSARTLSLSLILINPQFFLADLRDEPA